MEYTTDTAKVVIMVFICMAASTFTVCRGIQETVVNVQIDSSSLAQGEVLYTFQNQSGYQILHGKNCPQDIINIGGLDSQSVVLQRTVSFGDMNAYRPFCASPSAGAIAIQTYNCSIAINGQLRISLMINIVPTFFASGITFPSAFYSGSVVEGRENASVTIGAHSELLAQTQPIPNLFLPQYRLSGSATDVFRVHQQRAGCVSLPVIVTIGRLDREVQSYWELTLEAYAQHAPTTLVTSTVIGINVLDVNNKAPQIITSSGQSRLQVSENILPGTSLTRFRATDSDVGLNGAILFTTLNLSSYLSVHPLSGAVFFFRSVNHESITNLSVLLVAEDLGGPGPPLVSTPHPVEVFINRVDMTSPQLLIHGLSAPSSQLYEVSEMAAVGHQVTTVELRGEDTASLMLELENIGPCECFNLSSPVQGPSGVLFHVLVAHELTFEEPLNGKYQLQLTLKDNHVFVESSSLEVLVADENEVPNFLRDVYNFSVTEGVSVGTIIGLVLATDSDSGVNGTLTYTIVSQSPANLLAVDQRSGILYTNDEIDFETTRTIDAITMAEDGSGLVAVATISVNVVDRNDNPPVFSLASTNANVTITETHNADQVIFNFAAEDADSGCNGAVEYSILYADPNVFYLESSSGLLYPLNSDSLDFDKFETATVVVSATDLGEPVTFSATTVLHLQLTGVDDERPIIDTVDCPCFITENAPVSSPQAKCPHLSAHDPDSTILTFSIDNTLSPSVPFQIDHTTGVLSALRPLDREERDSYEVAVVVTDEAANTSPPQFITVRILDVNDEVPVYAQGTTLSFTVPSDLTPGDFVANLSARDADVGYNSIVIYAFASGTTLSILDTFTLDPLSGLLYTKAQLTLSSYTFSITARDEAIPSSRAGVSVTITTSGFKNNPPKFQLSIDHRIVPEDLSINSVVAILSASDSDQGTNGQITYSIVDNFSSNYSGLFSLESNGRLALAQSLSGRAGSTYAINVSAADAGDPALADYQSLIVRVYARDYFLDSRRLVYNPGIPVCHYNGTLTEATNADTLVVQLEPQVDSTNIHYTKLDEPDSAAPFSIVSFTLRTRSGFSSAFTNTMAVFITLLAQYGSNFFQCSVTIYINDVNNNPPYFSPASYSFETYINAPVGSSMIQVQSQDDDFTQENSRASYSITTPNIPFEINSDTGVIAVSQQLAVPAEYMFTVAAVDPSLPSMTATAMVNAYVLNASNSAPVFMPDEVTITYSEIVNSVTIPYQLSIADGDGNVNRQSINTFCIVSGNFHNSFTVTEQGMLQPNLLDYEAISNFNLTVIAYDNSLNPTSGTVTVIIQIQDENEPPVFSVPVYNASLQEGASVGSPVITVRAVDRDAGNNGAVIYSVPTDAPFLVNSRTGAITLKEMITNTDSIVFTVTATDGGSPPKSSTAEVRVSVIDINNNAPIFSSASRTETVPEDVAVGYEILSLSELTTDSDRGANGAIRYAIVSGNDGAEFSLDPWTGSLRTAQKLDYDSDPATYTLAIRASDLGNQVTQTATSTLTVIIRVTNANDNFPVFSATEYECNIEEQMSAFQTPCQVSATDADGASVMYSFVSPPTDTFIIGSSSGIVSPRSRVRSEDVLSDPEYIFQVQANDSLNVAVSILRIKIMDANDIPGRASIENSTYFIYEDIPVNNLLFFAHYHDMDTTPDFSSVTYGLLDENDFFSVEAETGAVFLTKELDHERQTSPLQLRVSGGNAAVGGSTQATYTINVLDAIENQLGPVFDPDVNPIVFWVPRSLITGSYVLTLNATDPDEGKSVTYDIAGGTGIGYFQIGRANGVVTISFPLASVVSSTLTLRVRAVDGNGVHALQSFHDITFSLSDSVTARPVFDYPVFCASPSENVAQVFHVVRATVDGTTGSSITYGISAGNEDNTFSIDPQTGAVSLAPSADLNREIQELYNITVTASRMGTPGISLALLVIDVQDADDFRPLFSEELNFTVFNSFPVGLNEPLARIFAVDDDLGENGIISYALQNLPSSYPFSISNTTGYIYLTQALAELSLDHYDITVSATGHSFPPSEVTFRISVLPPQTQGVPIPVTIDPITLDENSPQLTLVTRVTLVNQPFPVIFRILDQDAKVSILPNTGEVYLTGLLDYEADPMLTYAIQILDGVTTTPVTIPLVINVADKNDNRPQFERSSYSFSISEAQLEPDFPIGVVQATDRDSSAITNLTFSIVDASVAGVFIVNPSNGIIRLSADPSTINRENFPFYTLTISVSDGGNPPLLDFTFVTISITDSDDNNPVFRPASLDIYVSENIEVGQVIYTVSAFDPDLASSASISYELETVPATPFLLNSSTGDITVSSSLDAESQEMYELQVRAFNPNNRSRSGGILNLTIIVQDVLDSGPVLMGLSPASIRENYPPYSKVAQIQSSYQARPVYYSIVDGNQLDHFLIESVTGTVRTTTPLDRESVSSYELVIQGAYGIGYVSNFTLVVSVADANDEKPVFSTLFIKFTVPEHSRPLQPLGRINITNHGQNGRLSFAIVDNFAASIFSINSDGVLELKQNQVLDRENGFASLTFEVYAITEEGPNQFSKAVVEVDITDANDPPHFEQTDYTVVISTPLQVGSPQFRVQAVDMDDGEYGDLTYSLSAPGASMVFAIDSVTGYVSVIDTSMLLAEYHVMLTARDGGGLEASANLSITFSVCNFRNLTFTPSSARIDVSVLENATSGHVIVRQGVLDILDLSQQAGTMQADVSFSFQRTTPNFVINSNTGEITVVRLDREAQDTYFLVVQATDNTNPSRLAQALVIVTVLDVNDNSPQFSKLVYSRVITEEELQMNNYTYNVLPVSATDLDEGTNSAVTYRLIQPSSVFMVDPTTGFITLSASQELVPVGSTFQLVVEAIDGGEPLLSSTATVTITIVNSRAPRFTQSLYSIEVSENTPSNTPILNVTLDNSLETGPISFRFVGGSLNIPFSISSTGVITVVDPRLDYESQRRYNLTLRARDIENGLDGFAGLIVEVQDYNDVVPAFTESNGLYVRTIAENTTIGSVVLEVTANDEDSLPNAQITYTLNTNHTNLFVIDQMGGVSLNGNLDFERTRTYEYDIYAADSGSPALTGTAVVRFQIGNLNDNPPIFQQSLYTTSVQETGSAGPTDLFVSASDPDNLNTITYGIVEGPGSRDFTISGNGRLNLVMVNSTLAEYVLNVSAFDSMFYGYTMVRVTIEGVNANSPAFNSTSYMATVVEHSSPGVFVTQVFATDDDRGTNGEITYALDDTRDYFSINSTTGVITTSTNAPSIDREMTPVLTVLVMATDGGSLASLAQLRVTVQDVNDHSPTFDQDVFIGFTPHNTLNNQVLTVRASDRDVGSNAELVFTIENLQFNLPFRINSTTGVIYTFARPQVESQAHYQFNVTVMDRGSPPLQSISTTLVDITIIANNQSRLAFEKSEYVATLSENAAFGTTVISRIAIDDNSSMILCTPLILTPSNFPFVLVENDKIRVRTSSLQPRVYVLFVSTTCILPGDTMETSATATIHIQVLPVNDPPRFENLFYSATIPERNTTNPVVVDVMPQLHVIDPDSPDAPDGMIMYRLLNHNNIFTMIPGSGLLILNTAVDFEMVQRYVLIIEAYDQGSPSLTASSRIFVTVTDVDDNPPVFDMKEYVLEVFENRSIGDLIYTATVTDIDTVSTHSYSISGNLLSIGSTSGEIRLSRQLDREQFTNYTATITARDGSGIAEATLRLVILDANDNPPVFNQSEYSVSIEENYPTAMSFFQVFATDEDEGENAEIIFKPGNTFTSNAVSIDNVTGEIFFTRSPDFEASEQFTLHVLATDIFGRWEQLVPIVVTLEDVNDNAPVFPQSSYTAHISENRPVGSTVDIDNADRVEAVDADSGIRGRLFYTLAGPAADFFTIRDGDIESLVTFDREMNDSFDLIVIATDMGSPAMSANTTVQIRITDQNDNSPVFLESAYSIDVLESTPIGTPIFTVAATDADSGANGEIGFYSLAGTHSTDFDERENPNGSVTIYVDAVLDHEDLQKRQYQLTITAFDNGFMNGFSTREGSTSLTINVIDVDDNPPVFTMSVYTATVAENATILTTIVQVTAEDRDASDSSQLLYSIRNAGNTPEIGIVDTTGVLFVARSLDYEKRTSYSLEVMVAGGEPARVNIAITNVNDNPPVFPESSLSVNITENYQPSEPLVSLEASDVDSDDDRISYSIVAGNVGDRFTIGALGNVMVTTALDREERASYKLIIMAEDNDSPSLSSNITLIVEVLDVNDNAPVGGHQNIYVFTLYGHAPAIPLGEVFVNDSDSDAVNSHSYQLLPGSGTDNILIRNGFISTNTMNPTPGTYFFTVTVSDQGNAPVNTTISAYIRNVSRATLDSSFTLQVNGMTPQSFVDNKFGSFVNSTSDILRTKLLTEVDVQVISVRQSASSPSDTDLTIAVLNKTSMLYIAPLLVQHTLHVSRADLDRDPPGVTVATESVDLCSREVCTVGTSCLNLHQYSIGEMALGSRSITYLGVTDNHTSACVDPLSSLCTEDLCSGASTCFLSRSEEGSFKAVCLTNCSSQPCSNGGTCVDQASGYFCQCPGDYEGRNCELTTANFVSTSYAVFPSLQGYTSGSLSFEFNTETGGNSLLLYAGRFDADASDHMILTFDNNRACVLVSYGGGEKKGCVEPWGTFSNGQWHQVTVTYGPTVSSFFFIQCLLPNNSAEEIIECLVCIV